MDILREDEEDFINPDKIYCVSIQYENVDSASLKKYKNTENNIDDFNEYSDENIYQSRSFVREKQKYRLGAIKIKDKMDDKAYIHFNVDRLLSEMAILSKLPNSKSSNIYNFLQNRSNFRKYYSFGKKDFLRTNQTLKCNNENNDYDYEIDSETKSSNDSNSSNSKNSSYSSKREEETLEELDKNPSKKNKKEAKNKGLECNDIMRMNRNDVYETSENLIVDIYKLVDYSFEVKQLIYIPESITEQNRYREVFLAPEINKVVLLEKRLLDENQNQIASDERPKTHQIIKINEEKKKDKDPKSLRKLKITSVLILFLIIVYNTVAFIFESRANDTFKENFSMIRFSFEAINEIIWTSYLIRNILFTYTLNYTYNGEISINEFANTSMTQLQNSISEIQYIVNNISQSSLEISPQHKEILFSNQVPFYYIDQQSNNIIEHMSLINIITQV